MSIPHHKTKLSELTPEEYQEVMDRNDRQMKFLRRVCADARVRTGQWLAPGAVTHGIINAVEDSGLDLSHCKSQGEVTAVVLATLISGQQAHGVRVKGCKGA